MDAQNNFQGRLSQIEIGGIHNAYDHHLEYQRDDNWVEWVEDLNLRIGLKILLAIFLFCAYIFPLQWSVFILHLLLTLSVLIMLQ